VAQQMAAVAQQVSERSAVRVKGSEKFGHWFSGAGDDFRKSGEILPM